MVHVRWVNNTLVGGQTDTASVFTIAAPNTGSHSDVVVANNIATWISGTGTNSVESLTGLTFSHNLWYNVTAGSAAGTGDATGNPLLGQ